MKTVAVETLGCKVNQYETQLIKEQLFKAGFKEAPKGHPADIHIINTCTVTRRSDAESRRLIRNALRENPGSKVVVTGCYAELDKDEIGKIDSNLLIIRNSDKDKILQYLTPGAAQNEIPRAISRFDGRTKAFV